MQRLALKRREISGRHQKSMLSLRTSQKSPPGCRHSSRSSICTVRNIFMHHLTSSRKPSVEDWYLVSEERDSVLFSDVDDNTVTLLGALESGRNSVVLVPSPAASEIKLTSHSSL